MSQSDFFLQIQGVTKYLITLFLHFFIKGQIIKYVLVLIRVESIIIFCNALYVTFSYLLITVLLKLLTKYYVTDIFEIINA